MIGDSKEALERLSQTLSMSEIASLGKLIDYLLRNPNSSSLTSIELEGQRDRLREINSLIANSVYYIFDVYDSWIKDQGGNPEGYCLYRRRGDSLEELPILDSYDVPNFEEMLEYLSQNQIDQVYTGEIGKEGFLGYEYESTDEDDGHSITRHPLGEGEIDMFERNNVRVITLDSLL